MSKLLAVAARELRERWLLFPGALVAGLFPLVIPAFGVSRDVAPTAGAVGAALLGVAAAVVIGSSMLARDSSNGRLGFLFSRPLPWATIWGGKWLAALTLAASSAALAAIPWMLAYPLESLGGHHGDSWLRALGKSEGTPLFAVVLLLAIGLANFNGTAFRSRSAWLAVDLVLVLLAGWTVRRYVAPLVSLGIVGIDPLSRWGLLAPLGILAIALLRRERGPGGPRPDRPAAGPRRDVRHALGDRVRRARARRRTAGVGPGGAPRRRRGAGRDERRDRPLGSWVWRLAARRLARAPDRVGVRAFRSPGPARRLVAGPRGSRILERRRFRRQSRGLARRAGERDGAVRPRRPCSPRAVGRLRVEPAARLEVGVRPVAVGEPGPPGPRDRRVSLCRAVGTPRGDGDPAPRLAGRGHLLPRRGPGAGLARSVDRGEGGGPRASSWCSISPPAATRGRHASSSRRRRASAGGPPSLRTRGAGDS